MVEEEKSKFEGVDLIKRPLFLRMTPAFSPVDIYEYSNNINEKRRHRYA